MLLTCGLGPIKDYSGGWEINEVSSQLEKGELVGELR